MIRVLLLGVGGNVSQGILKSLRMSRIDTYIVGACISPFSVGLYMCDEAYISPYANESRFVDWVIDLCNKKNIDIIMTGVEEIIIEIKSKYDYLRSKTSALFVSSSVDQLMIGQDKYLTSKWLQENGCNYPKFAVLYDSKGLDRLINEVGFPLLVKPRRGKSSKGVRLVYGREELGIFEKDTYIAQEYIGDEDSEYTVGCYCDKQGCIRSMIILKRILRRGSTAYAKVIDNESIRNETNKICKSFKPIGPFNIQLRLDKKGTPVPFEFNVRFSGTTAMRANFGFCDVEAELVEYILHEDIDNCFNIINGEAFRFDEEIYIYDDSVQVMHKEGKVDDLFDRSVKIGNGQ